jgi:hypothetical protein
MSTAPISGKGGPSFLARHQARMRRVDSAITRLRKTAQASRRVAETAPKKR